jgi:hypothetical protein
MPCGCGVPLDAFLFLVVEEEEVVEEEVEVAAMADISNLCRGMSFVMSCPVLLVFLTSDE